MTTKNMRILTVVSCRKMHDHGGISVMWTYEDDDPFAVTLHAEGTDEFWQVDRQAFSDALMSCVPGIPMISGVASLQLRMSNPALLSLRLTTHTSTGEKYAFLVCSALDVAKFLDDVNKSAPKTLRSSVNDALDKIFS